MEITNIEKAAKLMGYDFIKPVEGYIGSIVITDRVGRPVKDFNPYTNKADLVDVECALEIQVFWNPEGMVTVNKIYCHSALHSTVIQIEEDLDDHPDKFTARAHAVMAVVEQIYDARFGKDWE